MSSKKKPESKYLSKLLHPPSDLTKYDNEPYTKNPLLRFRLPQIKERRHSNRLKEKAKLQKLKVCHRLPAISPLKPDQEDVVLPEEVYYRQIHFFANKTPIPKMLVSTEKKILSFVPSRLQTKYPQICEEYMQEVKDDYDKIIRAYSIQKIIKPMPGDYIPPQKPFEIKTKGRTENYAAFLRNRQRILKNLQITFPFIRCIIDYSNTDFPQVLNDISRYRNLGEIILDELENKVRKDLFTNSEFLKNEWYPKVSNIFLKHYKRKKLITKSNLSRVLTCGSALINRQITELKIRTIDRICEVIADRERIPYLKINLICEYNIDLYPSLMKIYRVYHEMLNDIFTVGNSLPSLEVILGLSQDKHDFLKICVGDSTVAECHDQLEVVLKVAYAPLIAYLHDFREEYSFLSSSDTENELQEYLTQDHSFEECLNRIDEIKVYTNKLKCCMQREFFDVAILNQYEAIQSLRQIGDELIDQIINQIVESHRKMSEDICQTFEEIKFRALEIPKSTEMLLESGEYMTHVKTNLIKELLERIEECLRIGGILIEFKELSVDHLQQQIATINWYNNIHEQLQVNAALHEMYKGQFEEHLQNVTKKLNEDIADLLPNLSMIDNMCELDKFREYYCLLQNVIEQLTVFDNYVSWINKEEKLYKFPRSNYPTLDEIKQFVIPFSHLMKICIKWQRYYNVWMDGPFEYLDPKFVAEAVEEYFLKFEETQKYYRNRIKSDLIGNPVCKFRGQTEDPDPEKHPAPLKLCCKMLNSIGEFRLGVQIVKIMCNPALRERHWNEMSEIVGYDLTPNAGTTLRKLINFKLDDRLPAFEIISIGANKELQLHQNLLGMIKEWETVHFGIGKHRKGIFEIEILTDLDFVLELLDDQLTKTLAMRGSAFVKPCEIEVLNFYHKLERINQTMMELLKVQQKLIYFLPMFSTESIFSQLEDKFHLYEEVKKEFFNFIDKIKINPLVIELAPAEGLLETLQKCSNLQDVILLEINKYFDEKRLFFHRFFFLSNEELLEILSETDNPKGIQHYLGKMFDGISGYKFLENGQISGVLSQKHEELDFVTKIDPKTANGKVELIFDQTQTEIRKSVQKALNLACKETNTSNDQGFITRHLQMSILTANALKFTFEVEKLLEPKINKQLVEILNRYENDLQYFLSLMRSRELSVVHRITVKTLIVSHAHRIEVLKMLIAKDVYLFDDFTWVSQMRFYQGSSTIFVDMIFSKINYGYEYIGNSDRLVITPLTNRCLRSIFGAYQLHMFSCIEGPAGTGKTETVRDLCRSLAIYCKTFNCSAGISFKVFGNFLKAIVLLGAWVCLDEFNRIDVEILSVTSQQIANISKTVQSQADYVFIDNLEIKINPECFVCVTMNPSYIGRNELPGNLRILFRNITMIVPDLQFISELTLFSLGFTQYQVMSNKVINCLRLCAQRLSPQLHYEFGLRDLVNILRTIEKYHEQINNEYSVTFQSVSDVLHPKICTHDLPIYCGIEADIFPQDQIPVRHNEETVQKIQETCLKLNLSPNEYFRDKLIQTFELLDVHHGIIIIGKPLSGKSTTWKVLQEMLEPGIQVEILNPKCLTLNELFGDVTNKTREYSDGVVPNILRKFIELPENHYKWLIFDGPIDTFWIENLNSLLDENRKLCLKSGEVLPMSKNMTIFFEVLDLNNASPATISRCGVVNTEASSIGWKAFIIKWMKEVKSCWVANNETLILELFDWVLPMCLRFITQHCHQYLVTGNMNLIRTTWTLFEMYLNDAIEENPDDYLKNLTTWFQAALILSITWGAAGVLDEKSRTKFDQYFRELWRSDDENTPLPDQIGRLEVSLPTEGIIFDYNYVFKQKGSWRYAPELMRRMEPEMTDNGLQVPTIDIARYFNIIELYIKHKKPFLIVGPSGTGKSFYVQNYFATKLSQEDYESVSMSFSVIMDARSSKELILSKLSKRMRFLFGSEKNKSSVIFIDDVNLPRSDPVGVQTSIELLREFLSYQFWHDPKHLRKIELENIFLVAACGLVGGSRQVMCPRFLSKLNIFSVNSFSDDTLSRIYNTVLLTGFKNRGHSSDVASSVAQIVSSTIFIYKSLQNTLKPTPQKSHYIFNVRDISKVINGTMCLRKESVDSKRMFPKIWIHETMRIFYDRLVNEEDRRWILKQVEFCAEEYFKENLATIFEEWKENEDDEFIDIQKLKSLMFGFYQDKEADGEERRYEEVNLDILKNQAFEAIEEYNQSHQSKLDVVLFNYALDHLNKICRVLSMPGGSCVLVGMSGSGRESLTKIAAQICKQVLFQNDRLSLGNHDFWRNTVKDCLRESGGKGQETVFLLNDTELKNEFFLQDIDTLLNLGEIPNIFTVNEKQEILEMVRLVAQGGNRNIDISPGKVYNFFINRCRQKLHMVLCFSLIGDTFRNKIRLYSSLLNCCIIDWFDPWPREALEMITDRYMSLVDMPDEVKVMAKVACQHFHKTSLSLSQKFFQDTKRVTYVTSASYLELNRTFANLMNKKQTETIEAKDRYLAGLETLVHASNTVALMQRDLNDLQPQLIIMAENSREMMRQIEKKTIEASEATAHVRADELNANAQAAVAQELKDECEKDLAQAIPVLEEAIQALNTLKPADITLVKSMKNPPEVVKLVMAAVCVIKGVPPDRVNDPGTGKKIIDYWGPSKRVLGDMGFLQSLKDFDKDNILPDIMKKIRKDFIPHKDFRPHIVAKASSAAEGLCKWIIAMDLYDSVAKVVAPKKARLEAAEKEYADTMKILNEKRQLAEELARKVMLLNEELAEANRQKQKVESEVKSCKTKLQRAESLISSLGGEKHRWTVAAENLQTVFDHLAGDILISSGIIAYLGPYDFSYRRQLYLEWHQYCVSLNIPCSPKFEFVDILGTEIKVQSWNISGLSRDIFSAENALIMDNSCRYSIFIDPQNQANSWIKKMEKPNKLRVVKFEQKDFMDVVEECMKLGRPCLIENIGNELELSLDQILFKNTFINENGTKCIDLGRKSIEINDNFQLYLISNKKSPQLAPEVYNKVTVINFALTFQGLEEQLLGIVVAKERPDLQELRLKIIYEGAQNKKTLKELEESILRTLSSSRGDILEDKNAIQILDDSKVLFEEIKEKQIISKESERIIDKFRYSYRSVAQHSTTLYYSVVDLSNINPMYHFSLKWYINLFIHSIENANKSKEIFRRLKFLMDAITLNLYNNVCRSIFEKDKLLFSFLLTAKIMMSCDQVDSKQFIYLLRNKDEVKKTDKEKPNADWLTQEKWNHICYLEEMEEFRGFPEDFAQTLNEWHEYYKSMTPETQKIPNPWYGNTNRFEKLLILQAIRPDRVAIAIYEFVASELGPSYVVPPPFDLAKSFDEANCLMPLIFLLGSDPMQSLTGFARKMGFDKVLQTVSMGEDQGENAKSIISAAQKSGNWVCLQNCHLVPNWLPVLETIWENTTVLNTAPTYRLWLTTDTCSYFPITLLQNGVKITKEPPSGLKENLLRMYNSEPMNNAKFYSGCPAKYREFTKLLYAFCFFHSVIQERKQFGPIGWSLCYDFNELDFFVSVSQLQKFINKTGRVEYEGIVALTAECNYGGKINSEWDQRTVYTMLKDYFTPKVITDICYEFYPTENHIYDIPRKFEHRDMVNHIEMSIPTSPSTNIYGLHTNAQIRSGNEDSLRLVSNLKMTLGKVEELQTDEKEKALLGYVEKLQSTVPKLFNLDEVKERFQTDFRQTLNAVVLQEAISYNFLIEVIEESLKNLKKVIFGTAVYTKELDEMASEIMKRKIPKLWLKLSYPCLKPIGSFTRDLSERASIIKNWMTEGIPTRFWFPVFFSPNAFTAAVLQNYSRKYNLPITDLELNFQIQTLKENEDYKDVTFIYGPYLEGARWNVEINQLDEEEHQHVRDFLPDIAMIPVKKENINAAAKYLCPIYKTHLRRSGVVLNAYGNEYVFSLPLNTTMPAYHWIKRGVAIICQTPE